MTPWAVLYHPNPTTPFPLTKAQHSTTREIWNFAIMKTGLRWIAIKFVGFVPVPLSTKTHTLKCLLAI
jgi:hypothetical protein